MQSTLLLEFALLVGQLLSRCSQARMRILVLGCLCILRDFLLSILGFLRFHFSLLFLGERQKETLDFLYVNHHLI